MTDEICSRNRSTIAAIAGARWGLGLAIGKRRAREGSAGIVVSDQNVREPAYPGQKGAPQHHWAGLTSLFQAIEMALERK